MQETSNQYFCLLYENIFLSEIVGGDETPYKGGVFMLEITVPDRYDCLAYWYTATNGSV